MLTWTRKKELDEREVLNFFFLRRYIMSIEVIKGNLKTRTDNGVK